jgi:hypothetical protein
MKLRGVRVFYTLQDIFEHVRESISTDSGLRAAATLFGPATSEALTLASALGWLAPGQGGTVHPTQAGLDAHPIGSRSLRLRFQLHSFVLQTKPSWSALLCRGRREAAALLPSEIRQCLFDAGLLDGTDAQTVQWWDSLSIAARTESQHELLNIGRIGERLSLQYEQERVGKIPLWQALESNAAGYDILSWLGKQSPERLLIEVKCSVLPMDSAWIHITRTEWQTAMTAKHAAFHIWSVRSNGRSLWVKTRDDLRPHISINQGNGEWETVRIPGSAIAGIAPTFSDNVTTPLKELLPDSFSQK